MKLKKNKERKVLIQARVSSRAVIKLREANVNISKIVRIAINEAVAEL